MSSEIDLDCDLAQYRDVELQRTPEEAALERELRDAQRDARIYSSQAKVLEAGGADSTVATRKANEAREAIQRLKYELDIQYFAKKDVNFSSFLLRDFVGKEQDLEDFAKITDKVSLQMQLTKSVNFPKERMMHLIYEHPERLDESLKNVIQAIESPALIAPNWDVNAPLRANSYVFAHDIQEKEILGVYVKIQTDQKGLDCGLNNWIITAFRSKRNKFLKKYGNKNLIKK